jgi:hypothetical protein
MAVMCANHTLQIFIFLKNLMSRDQCKKHHCHFLSEFVFRGANDCLRRNMVNMVHLGVLSEKKLYAWYL